jgi:hypothetical protein
MIEIMKPMAAYLGKGNFAVFCNEVEVSDLATVAELGYPRHLETKRVVNPKCKFCLKQRTYRLFLVPHANPLRSTERTREDLDSFPVNGWRLAEWRLEMGVEYSVTIPDDFCSCISHWVLKDKTKLSSSEVCCPINVNN